ncbi:hypothetical protein V5799_007127 [Amblyomma americanum]|uniref:Uncharacterized protein n=1 Tax=Amblyomma americanum TaxID=6943 RepID=A0AAQ4DUF1_AMBAM
MDETCESRDRNEFSWRLKSLRPLQRQPTLNFEDRYKLSRREAELLDRVRFEDCVVALATVQLQRQLFLAAIYAERSQRAVIIGERISEDDDFCTSLDALLPVDVHVLHSASRSRDSLDGVYLAEPDLFATCLDDGISWTNDIPLVIIRDFQRYLDPNHPYRKIIASFIESRRRKASSKTRLLAVVEKLDVCDLETLESKLKSLRTPLNLTCFLGTSARPYVKDVVIEVRLVRLHHHSLDTGKLPWLDEWKLQSVGAALREWGIMTARSQAQKVVAGRPPAELRDFLSQYKRLLIKAKAKAVLDCVQGRSVALVSTIASRIALKHAIRAQKSGALIGDPRNAAIDSPAVFVATMADVSTLAGYFWNAVLLCDVPAGVDCDELFRNAHRKIAVATEPEWMSWEQTLKLYDDVEEVLQRVNG